MDPQMITFETQPTPKGHFQPRVFWRMLGVIKPYRRTLALGTAGLTKAMARQRGYTNWAPT